jgi:predicted transcriptional regulator
MMDTKRYDKLLEEELRDDEFRREYEETTEEFEVAKEVIALRKMANMTQKELASRVGTSQPAIARLESGNYRNLSLAFLKRVAHALGAVTEIHIRRENT